MSERDRSWAAARASLYALVPRGMVLGLETMQTALAALGDPQRAIPTVHIAGTNGKGSVSAMVEAALRADGRRTGLYTSPHLHRFTERIRVNGREIDEATVAEHTWRVLDAIERHELPALTFFEAATVIAWEVFARSRIAHSVLEVGLGGRLDATNVCAPTLTAITRIARDHESRLGNTLDAIAREKAGILKSGVPCVLGPDLREGEASSAIREVAQRVGAPIVESPKARLLGIDDALHATIEVEAAGGAMRLDLALGGAFQVGNAAVAVRVLEMLGLRETAIREGLASVVWPARMEVIDGILFDAAHNPDGVAALCESLVRLGERGPRALVFGASSDKDWRAMLDLLVPRFVPERRFYCAAALRRAEQPRVLADHAAGVACGSVGEALDGARRVSGRAMVLVCGSIFTVAEARARVLGIESEEPVPL